MTRFFSSSKVQDAGPYYDNIAQYPKGFQPLHPADSLNNAFDVVQNICQDLDTKVKSGANNQDVSSRKDYETSLRIVMSIKELINSITDLKEWLNANFGVNIDTVRAIDLVQAVVNQVNSIPNILNDAVKTTNSPLTNHSLRALADIIHITRRSIPPIEIFHESKSGISHIRDIVVGMIKAGPAAAPSGDEPTTGSGL